MPDSKLRLDDSGRVVLDAPTPGERAQAVVACGRCDDDGYRGTVVCDHVDRTETAQAGIERVRAILRTRDTREAGSVASRATSEAGIDIP